MTPVNNFWQTLPKPFFVLAPMEDVTDPAFRTLIAQKGKPDVTFTEFTSGDGLVLAPEDRRGPLLKKLQFGDAERPMVAQLFGSTPENMEKAARLAVELGFDGLDINMGCPVKKIVDQGCGSGLIRTPERAQEIIRAAKRGVDGKIPVSVKTRIGYNVNELDTWLPLLLREDLAAITIHARTRKEMSEVPAHWDAVAQAVRIRNEMGSKTLIIGNGDVKDIADARVKAAAAVCDGIMLGRAIYGNPWLFADRADIPTPKEKMETLIEHIHLFEKIMTGFVSFALMKKHFKAYISGWDGAKELRVRLMDTNSPQEAIAILESAL